MVYRGCTEHGFKVDELTLEATWTLVMKCPKSGKLTRVGFDGGTLELLVLPVGQDSKDVDKGE